MWDKLNIFGWTKKKPAIQPIQRDVSVTLTNGERRETIQRSPSGNKLASSSSVQHGQDDDESSEGSTSFNFGFRPTSSPRRNSSFTFSREPLDLPTWSKVTSPGFTSRLVLQASESGHCPLKELNDSLSHSPFRKSPYKNLTLGELPYVNFSRRPKSPPSILSSTSSTQKFFRSGVSSSTYNRDRRRNARQGQVFVRIAPIDPSCQANVSITRTSTSPPIGGLGSNNGSPYPPRGSPRAGSEPYRNDGLGGIPQQELAMRFNRLWPPSPGGSVPGPGRPSSPTSPSNIVEALTVGRKRARDPEPYYPPNATPPSSPPPKISIGIGDTPVRSQMSKRVKFLGTPECHDRPMMVGYAGMAAGDNEPLSSESILEQMNQTEKRFLPDSTSTPYSTQKRNIRMAGCGPIDDQSPTLQNALRKRRSQTNMINAVDEDPNTEKLSRFCRCNECYAEAAGISIESIHGKRSSSSSPNKSNEKSTNTGDSKTKDTCDKSINTDFDRSAFFKDVFRKGDRTTKKPEDNRDRDILPLDPVPITKEMFDKDKKKRIERYYHLLQLKPPGGTIFDVLAEAKSTNIIGRDKPSDITPAAVASVSSPAVLGSTSNNATTPATTTTAFTLDLGTGAPTVSSNLEGFSFGKQTSPVAPTITTTACTTITSPSSSGTVFGQNVSITTPAMGSTGGIGLSAPSTALTTQPPSSTGFSFGGSRTTTTTGQVGFTTDEKDRPKQTEQANNNNNDPNPSFSLGSNTTVQSGRGGFNFGGGSPAQSAPAATPLSAAPLSTIQPSASTTGFPSAQSTPGASTTAGIFQLGQPQPAPGGAAGFSFGQPATATASGFGVSAESAPSSTQASNQPSSSAGFSFGTNTTTANQATLNNEQDKPKPAEQATSNAGQNLSFSLGSNTNPVVQSGRGGFNFGGGAPSSSAPATAQNTPGAPATAGIFQFSQSQAAPGGIATPFPFGQPTTSSTSGGLSAPSTTLASNQPSSSTGFSFGGNTTATGQAPFTSEQDKSKPADQASTKNDPNSISSLGSNTGVQSGRGGFNFGSGAPAPSAPATQPASTGFSFGQSAPAATTASSGVFQFTQPQPATGGTTFPFGQPTTSSTSGFGFSAPSTTPANTQASSSTGFSFGGSTTGTGQAVFTTDEQDKAKSKEQGSNNVGENLNSAFSLGSNTMVQSGRGGFNFGGGAPASPASTGFPFGQSAPAAPATASAGVFQFSQPQAAPAGGGASTFAFGQPVTRSTTGFGLPAPSTTLASNQPPSSGFNFGGNTTTTGPGTFTTDGQDKAKSTEQASNNNGPNPSFSLGSNTMVQSGRGGFNFGSGAPAPSAPVAAPPAPASTGFPFGQSTPAAPAPAGVFQFGQPQPAPGGAAAFPFGQQPAQGVPGGFNFAAVAPQQAGLPPGQPMFSMGSSSTAPRRRDVRRRFR